MSGFLSFLLSFSFLGFIFFGWSYRSLSWVRVSRLLCTYQGGFQRNLKWESQGQRGKIPCSLHHAQSKNLRGVGGKVRNTFKGYFYMEKPNQTCCTN